MVEFRSLNPYQWRELRKMRLRALRDSPDTFLATYDAEKKYTKARWMAEFARGTWIVGELRHRRVFHLDWPGHAKVSLVGITRDSNDDSPPPESVTSNGLVTERTGRHFVEFMWVTARHRKSGIAHKMLTYAIDDHFLTNGVSKYDESLTAKKLYLWVLDGNFPAISLYKRMGFVAEGISNPLKVKPGRREDQLSLNLREHFSAINRQLDEINLDT